MIDIGNWIEINGQFHKIKDAVSLHFYSQERWSYKPIIITKDILCNSKFIPVDVYTDQDSYIFDDFKNDFIQVDICKKTNAICVDNNTINYVHELQNYYKGLTGEELTITL